MEQQKRTEMVKWERANQHECRTLGTEHRTIQLLTLLVLLLFLYELYIEYFTMQMRELIMSVFFLVYDGKVNDIDCRVTIDFGFVVHFQPVNLIYNYIRDQ